MWGVNPGQFEEKYGQNSSYTCIKFAKNKLKIIIKKIKQGLRFWRTGIQYLAPMWDQTTSITLVPRDPTPFSALWASNKPVAHRYTCTQNTHAHGNKSNLIKNETALCCELQDDLHFPVSGEFVAPFSSPPNPNHPPPPAPGGLIKPGFKSKSVCLHTGPIMFGSRDRTASKEWSYRQNSSSVKGRPLLPLFLIWNGQVYRLLSLLGVSA